MSAVRWDSNASSQPATLEGRLATRNTLPQPHERKKTRPNLGGDRAANEQVVNRFVGRTIENETTPPPPPFFF